MTTIKLNQGFFIEVDDRNFTLKSEYINKKTKGKAIRTHGYFPSLESCTKNYIKLATLDANDGETIELHELLEKIKAVCEKTVEVLKGGVQE